LSTVRRATRRALAALAAACAVAGCRAAVDRVFTPPTAVLRGVAVQGFGIQGAELVVTVALANPNPYPLSATGATYQLFAADSIEVGRGSSTVPLRVGGRDSTLVQLPIAVTWSGLGRAGRVAARGGAVDYRVVGEVLATTPLGERAVPIDARGRFAALSARR
jgi:LEA14-like dessication related protein